MSKRCWKYIAVSAKDTKIETIESCRQSVDAPKDAEVLLNLEPFIFGFDHVVIFRWSEKIQ